MSTASTSKAANQPTAEEKQANLGILEEDDEFEEFPVADWDDSKTVASIAGAQPGGAKSSGDKLWEDNWDDDDIEDEFSVQLRNELQAKEAGGDDMQQ